MMQSRIFQLLGCLTIMTIGGCSSEQAGERSVDPLAQSEPHSTNTAPNQNAVAEHERTSEDVIREEEIALDMDASIMLDSAHEVSRSMIAPEKSVGLSPYGNPTPRSLGSSSNDSFGNHTDFSHKKHQNEDKQIAGSAADAVTAETLGNEPYAYDPEQPDHLSHLPSGASHDPETGFATVKVFYATDRKASSLPLSAYHLRGQRRIFVSLVAVSVGSLVIALISLLVTRKRTMQMSMFVSAATGLTAIGFLFAGQSHIEKHGVTYTAERGSLVRGVCEVTVPDSHQRGLVERPSLLKFEVAEDQTKHIVLTEATELSGGEFNRQLANLVSQSSNQDLLVFIHGYNVDFESAVQRTAQIAVDLPFEGVPVCYSWPSQGTLVGYTIDENNSAWTTSHLRSFLLELADESGAKSINVVAHSMGNRAMTAAMQQIQWQMDKDDSKPFDRVVLAAPDVDADQFRRDFANPLLNVANHVTLYASSDDQALIASKTVHGHPRAGESGDSLVVFPGIETIDVSGIDLSLLGHSYYGDNESMLRDLYELVRVGLPAAKRERLVTRGEGARVYWQLAQQHGAIPRY